MPLKYIDLFAGIGGFHIAMQRLGFECVFASEIDDELRDLYIKNFPDTRDITYGDIRGCKDKIPPHDILCAGFPCQPFSKSGAQKGILDETRGTLFHEILEILEQHRPEYVILENVGNFERHDKGRTWRIVHDSLIELDYDVKGTVHKGSGGTGLLSPHHLGYPHSRERFFIVARQGKLPENPFPKVGKKYSTSLESIIQQELSEKDKLETKLSNTQFECIEHWNTFLAQLPEDKVELPSFPIWGDEIDAMYPYETNTPYVSDIHTLRACLKVQDIVFDEEATQEELLALLPSYARTKTEQFPSWKRTFIRQNRDWFRRYRDAIPQHWVKRLREFSPSLRKLEWNCKGEERDLWKHVLQFRPSGLRVKRFTSSPALVAMTATQIPLLGPERRFLTRVEGLRLQGFPENHHVPNSRQNVFKALGNAVHVDVVVTIAKALILEEVEDHSPKHNLPVGTLFDHTNGHSQLGEYDLPLFAHAEIVKSE